MNRWSETKQRQFSGFDPLPETKTEKDHVSGKLFSWQVHVYENFQSNYSIQNSIQDQKNIIQTRF